MNNCLYGQVLRALLIWPLLQVGRSVVQKVREAMDQTVESFLNDAHQISPGQVAVQVKAEALGYL
jgi:hypothetical protein